MKTIKFDNPFLIYNLKHHTIKRIKIDINNFFHKIAIKQRRPCFSNDSKLPFKNNGRNSKIGNLHSIITPKKVINRSKKDVIDYSSVSTTHYLPTKNKNNWCNKNDTFLLKNNLFNNFNNTFMNFLSPRQLVNPKFLLKNKIVLSKTEDIKKDLEKVFSYNRLPWKDRYKFKFAKPKSYLRQCPLFSNEDSFYRFHSLSSDFILSICSKNYYEIMKNNGNIGIKDISKNNKNI